ncbi:MAG TPA: hypothetical protein DIW64_07465, partial [Cellvibrio sp.]|nr:hypothetical protein [Cellvibrio sp.]
MAFSWSANAAIAINVPATDADGNYTVSWTGMGVYVTLYEKVNNGGWNSIDGGSFTSKSFSGKPAGSYSYMVYNYCPAPSGPPSSCGSSEGTVVVGIPAPIVAPISNVTINEDNNTQLGVNVTYAGTASLIYSATSNNQALISNSSLILSGSGNSRTLSINPAVNASGTATITVTVVAGTKSSSVQFVVTVNPVNDAPVISMIANQTLSETGSKDVPFTVTDVDSAVGSVSVSTSSSVVVVPQLTGSGSYVLKLTAPRMGSRIASHQATITISVTNTPAPVTKSFTVTVNNLLPELWIEPTGTVGVYDLKWDYGSQAVRLLENGVGIEPITSLPPSGTKRITKTNNGTFTYSVSDCDGSQSGLVCSGSYSPKSITVTFPPPTVMASISPSTINEAGSATLTWSSTNASNCSATNISGVSGLSGTAQFNAPTVMSSNQVVNIEVTCTGTGGSTPKTVPITINWVNDRPIITTPSPTIAAIEDTPFTVPFTVSDEETTAASLTVTAASSDTSKIASISVDRPNNRLNVTPVADANGNVSIVMRVTDAQGLY